LEKKEWILGMRRVRPISWILYVGAVYERGAGRAVWRTSSRGGNPVRDVVAVVGVGLLSDFVYDELFGKYEVIRHTVFKADAMKAAKLVLVLQDNWRPSDYLQAEEALKEAGLPWLSGFVLFDEGVVGPMVRKGTPGCSQCADMRRIMAGRGRENTGELQMRLLMDGAIPRDSSTSRLGLLQMGYLIAAETQKVLQGKQAHTEGRVFMLDLKTLKSSLHPFLPDPLCSICGALSEDSPTNARISLRPSPKVNPETYRCKSMNDLTEVLVKDYLDDRMGLLNEKTHDPLSLFSDVIVNLPSFIGNVATAGRSHSYMESGRTAILEGLERYCGISPRGKRTVIYDSFRNLAHRALDPVEVGVYSAEQYAQPDFLFEPFDPDLPIDWVWGYSFLQERPILVPEQLAYYSTGFGGGFVHEGSNGCALGGSLEEAIFYGILEVVERDSFLMTWYAQLTLPRLDPYSANDKEFRLMVDRLQLVAGYDVSLFNATMENGIPSIWAMVKNRNKTGANLICAAGAHVDPIRAAKSAIYELAGNMMFLNESFESNREEIDRMFVDPFLVRRMEDHALLYCVPQAEERLQFLLDQNLPLRAFDEEFKQRKRYTDLTEELKDILQEFHRLKLNVIVIDQTTPETVRNGLYCVKVLIPGMLPITYGHHLTRLTGLDRVLRVPMELGFEKQLLMLDMLNPHPHPFP
jgi:ribosomal protein S12 methylthiotransferase accessory factor